jgi:hypothetical protein
VRKLGKQSAVVAALGSGLAFGCVLFVDEPKDLSGTCHFAGEEAACGSCLASACRSLVDQCCSDNLCRNQITDVDACANSGGAACVAIAYPTSGSPASDALAACLLGSCDKPCGTVSGVGPPGETPASSTNCVVPSDGRSCRCKVPSGSETSNAATCSPAIVANAACCADLDWPLAGTSCDCRTVACETSNGGAGCKCSTGSTGPLTSCSTGGGCCQIASTCECGANPNLCALTPPGTAGIKSVASCGRSTVGCGTSSKAVSRCSAQ